MSCSTSRWPDHRVVRVPGDRRRLHEARSLTAKTATTVDDHLVPLARTALRVGSLIAAILLIAQSQGFSVTTLVAGLGLGGLAVALAAKDTLANVLGSLAIVSDRPFQVGDWCWWTATKEPWSGSGCARPGSAPSTTRWSASRQHGRELDRGQHGTTEVPAHEADAGTPL